MKIYKINGKMSNSSNVTILRYIGFIDDTFRDYLDYLFLLDEYKEPSGSTYRNDLNLALENFITLGQDNVLDKMIQDDEFSNAQNIFIAPWFVGSQFYSEILYYISESHSSGDFRYHRMEIYDSRVVLSKEIVIDGDIQNNRRISKIT